MYESDAPERNQRMPKEDVWRSYTLVRSFRLSDFSLPSVCLAEKAVCRCGATGREAMRCRGGRHPATTSLILPICLPGCIYVEIRILARVLVENATAGARIGHPAPAATRDTECITRSSLRTDARRLSMRITCCGRCTRHCARPDMTSVPSSFVAGSKGTSPAGPWCGGYLPPRAACCLRTRCRCSLCSRRLSPGRAIFCSPSVAAPRWRQSHRSWR